MENISSHITFKEGTHSDTATRRGIRNIPDDTQLANMRLVADHVFEPMRRALDSPIRINSFFRCQELNKIIGGSVSSQHCAYNGSAIDMSGIDVYNKTIFDYIKDNLSYDQLIAEYPKNGEPSWVHVSYVHGNNRNEVLVCCKDEKNRTIYKKYEGVLA